MLNGLDLFSGIGGTGQRRRAVAGEDGLYAAYGPARIEARLSDPYVQTKVNGKKYRLHRWLMEQHLGGPILVSKCRSLLSFSDLNSGP